MNRQLRTALFSVFVGVPLLTVASACGFRAPARPLDLCAGFDKIGLTDVTGLPPQVVLEDPGTIKVMHGSGSSSYFQGVPVKVEQSAELPAYANQATVFLNGWDLGYKGGDQHVLELGTMIARIRVQPGKITWNAVGMLADDDSKEAYNWKYYYTVVAWNDGNLHAMVDHNDIDHCDGATADATDNYFMATNDNMTTALAGFTSILQNPGFASGRSVAIVPRGYGFAYTGGDHHLLQLGYNLESGESFVHHQGYQKGNNTTINPVPNPAPARVSSDFATWNSYVILKDDSARRDIGFAEIVSGIGGADVSVVQPAFRILPIGPVNGGLGGASLKSAQVTIDNLPYAYAVPMLTGWEIGYGVSDQHVKEMGIWIDNVRYDRISGNPTGRLQYNVFSILKDNDTFPDNFYNHKVTILGLKALTPGVVLK